MRWRNLRSESILSCRLHRLRRRGWQSKLYGLARGVHWCRQLHVYLWEHEPFLYAGCTRGPVRLRLKLARAASLGDANLAATGGCHAQSRP